MKKKVLLHSINSTIGGTKTVLNAIVNSYLNEKYHFVFINQNDKCGINLLKSISFIKKYKKLIDAEKADVIYICGLQYTGLLMTIAAKLSNVKKIVLSVHGSEWDAPDKTLRKKILMHIVEPLEVRLAHSVFTVCEFAQKKIGALKFAKKGCNKGVVYNTFPNIEYESVESGKLRKELNISSDKIIVVTVGRVVVNKGHKDIIKAIKCNNDNRFVYIVVGEGDYVKKYEIECATEILEKKLFLLGVRNDVKEILKDSDIFLFATYNENHSMALLEAVNMKCAGLITNVGGNSEIIQHHISGLVIPPRDPDAIVKGLLELSDSAIRKKYSEYAYKIAKEKFSISKTYGKLDCIFNE